MDQNVAAWSKGYVLQEDEVSTKLGFRGRVSWDLSLQHLRSTFNVCSSKYLKRGNDLERLGLAYLRPPLALGSTGVGFYIRQMDLRDPAHLGFRQVAS